MPPCNPVVTPVWINFKKIKYSFAKQYFSYKSIIAHFIRKVCKQKGGEEE